jgi:hypothetical protein
MKKPKAYTKRRQTLNKQIAAAPTHAQKWHTALTGGKTPSPIERLVSDAAGWHNDTPQSPEDEARQLAAIEAYLGEKIQMHQTDSEWRATNKAKLKNEFADMFLPALMAGDPAPFEALIRAIRAYRAEQRTLAPTLGELCRRQKVEPSKKEKGRIQRYVLLDAWLQMKQQSTPPNLENLKAGIAKHDCHPSGWLLFGEDSTIIELMAELGMSFHHTAHK